ncbi:MAG: PEP-CTERM sorting domain-containing protein [Bryobacterales bacterium]|nr:PEP-CTERM sorting domain-containing protein [Bryobacterales bacterium]
MFRKISLFSSVLALLFVVSASASPLNFCGGGSDPAVNLGSYAYPGVTATAAGGANAVFSCKTKDSVIPGGNLYGLGVNGQGNTPGEIDSLNGGESITFDFGPAGAGVEEFGVMVFYNGPEFGDPGEKGQVEVTFLAGGTAVYFFQADADGDPNNNSDGVTNTVTSNLLGSYTVVSPFTENNAGAVQFTGNPFGGALIRSLKFTAIPVTGGTNNNSDYAISNLTFTGGATEEIPEPGTYAMMGLGLLAVGFLKRRAAKKA